MKPSRRHAAPLNFAFRTASPKNVHSKRLDQSYYNRRGNDIFTLEVIRMASTAVKEQTRKIQESCNKLQNTTGEMDIRNEVEKIKQACSVIESQL
jgi:hypothetical protein